MSKTSGQPPVRGRNKYEQWLTEDSLAKLRAWARNGLTDADIAHNCGINRDTLKEWKKRFPAISAALKEGKDVVDQAVENALFKSACGYEYEEVTTEYNAAGEITSSKTVRKYQAPNVVAQIYWLKNRRRDVWKNDHDRYEIEKARLELDTQKTEADMSRSDGAKIIEVIIDPEAEAWGH